MDMESKEKIVQPVNDEKLENASGGLGSKVQFDKIRYRCTACGYENIFRMQPSACPQCRGKMTIIDIPFGKNR